MKVCILEWICGGGRISADLEGDLLTEGQQMLSTLIDGALRAQCSVSIALDERLESSPGFCRPKLEVFPVADQPENKILNEWARLAANSDATLVVAPELQGSLCRAIHHLNSAIEIHSPGVKLLNCKGGMLEQAADKWFSYSTFERLEIPTPDTLLLANATETNLDQIAAKYSHSKWVVKPRDGAGCEEIAVFTKTELAAQRAQAKDHSTQIVQPWLESKAYSCSAIVDDEGTWNWLPVVSQELTLSSAGKNLHYVGGQLVLDQKFPKEWKQQLEREFAGAKGWLSFDFFVEDKTGTNYLIEINPRCTTSMVTLAEKYTGNLIAELLGVSPCQDYSNHAFWR